jgi:hypothetical protein
MKISKILWIAANEKLHPTSEYSAEDWHFSCDAVWMAELPPPFTNYADSKACQYLLELGCNTGIEAMDEFERGPERQGARYLWLDFARLVAKDESV